MRRSKRRESTMRRVVSDSIRIRFGIDAEARVRRGPGGGPGGFFFGRWGQLFQQARGRPVDILHGRRVQPRRNAPYPRAIRAGRARFDVDRALGES